MPERTDTPEGGGTPARIGFLGLGIMGSRMAANLEAADPGSRYARAFR
jgi:predicted homoserine dehydrogenase-like protein